MQVGGVGGQMCVASQSGPSGAGGEGEGGGRRWAAANLYSFGAKGETLEAVVLFRVRRRCRLQKHAQKKLGEHLRCRFLFFGVQVQKSKRLRALAFGSWITILIHSAVPYWRHWVLITRLLFFHFLNKKSEQEGIKKVQNNPVKICLGFYWKLPVKSLDTYSYAFALYHCSFLYFR